jgi:hypothetical protein
MADRFWHTTKLIIILFHFVRDVGSCALPECLTQSRQGAQVALPFANHGSRKATAFYLLSCRLPCCVRSVVADAANGRQVCRRYPSARKLENCSNGDRRVSRELLRPACGGNCLARFHGGMFWASHAIGLSSAEHSAIVRDSPYHKWWPNFYKKIRPPWLTKFGA